MPPTDTSEPLPSGKSEMQPVISAVETALDACPAPGSPPSQNPWHDLLYGRLRDEALPALILDDSITPAGSLWSGSRLWTDAFRHTDLQAGDRLVVALPPSPAFVQALVAALWEGLSVALASPSDDIGNLLETLDARAAVTSSAAPHSFVAHERAGPESSPDPLRDATSARSPDVRFLLRTSGTTGTARWVALSDRNVLSVLASHLPHLSLKDARVLSVLPWAHAFGLVLDFFPALLSGAELIRDPHGGRRPDHLIDLHKSWGTTHLSAVPLVVDRLFDSVDGRRLLRQLDGGIVGGAPVSGPLAQKLSDTSLRAGYGQTEASPGITLGAPGTWGPQYLGQPVGCTVELASDGELTFQGPNACIGVWRDGSLHRTNPERRVRTGDLAEREGQDYYFRGRKDHSFKLSNGRWVRAGAVEADLKSEIPVLRDVLVFTPNGKDVAVALCVDDSETAAPEESEIRSVLGSLGQRLVWTPVLKPTDWSTTPKGSVDRSEMKTVLRESYDHADS